MAENWNIVWTPQSFKVQAQQLEDVQLFASMKEDMSTPDDSRPAEEAWQLLEEEYSEPETGHPSRAYRTGAPDQADEAEIPEAAADCETADGIGQREEQRPAEKIEIPAVFSHEPDDTFWQSLNADPGLTLYKIGFDDEFKSRGNLRFLYHIARRFVKALNASPLLEAARGDTPVDLEEEDYNELLLRIPPGNGREYIDQNWIAGQWQSLQNAFRQEAENWTGSMATLLQSHQPKLQPAQRVYFTLVENKPNIESGEGKPFAFVATYTLRDRSGKLRYVPLSYIMKKLDKNDPHLLKLLGDLSKAAEVCPILDEFIVSGEIFHPLMLSSDEALEILKAIPRLEAIGISSRIPMWWRRQSASAGIVVSIGGKKPSLLGLDTLISLRPSLYVNGRKLTKKEIKDLLAMDEGLYLIKGAWTEVNHEKLEALLAEMEQFDGEITLAEALKRNAGLGEEEVQTGQPVEIERAKWLDKLLEQLRHPGTIKGRKVPKSVHAVLRPYQEEGVKWLLQLADLGFGACLADDMGLGKTLQLLTSLETWRQSHPEARVLLAAPASLLGNWEKEIKTFTPDMPFQIVHPSRKNTDIQAENFPYLTITTYGMLSRLEALSQSHWDILVLDEAQAIKNAGTRQTKIVKSIKADRRIALTGTPIENDLGNLWSLFDFLNGGLLGTRKEFSAFAKSLDEHPENYGRLQNMIQPFLLRRLKSDPNIVPDLPDKLEKIDYVPMSKKQTALYNQQVNELEKKLENAEDGGIARKGLVLGTLTRLKQICNHPDQFTGQTAFDPKDSGKFEFLAELCENIKERHECVLVFTQFKEIIPQLDEYLAGIFNARGMVITGDTPAARRTQLTERFNEQKEYIPYMVLSLRAAGTGLNLTAASHVIHFDRWWNPAVENQATDRAYRIGQHKNVVVHKLVAKDTIEEKIDEMISSKKELAEKVVEGSQVSWLTQMSNAELMAMLRSGL